MNTLPHNPILNGIKSTNRITRYYRISRISTHTLAGVFLVALVLPLSSKNIKSLIIKWWCKRLLAAFNIRVLCTGNVPLKHAPFKKTMIVANHISWTDIHALNSLVALRFVAKDDIKNWPVFGFLMRGANTLFIERGKRQDAGRIVNVAAISLMSGDNLCFFPEGTTTDGSEIKPFKSSLMQAAIDSNASIQPVAIRYPGLNGSINTNIAYAGETTMLESMQQLLLQKNPLVELHFFSPIQIEELTEDNKDRRALTLQIQQQIQQKLGL
ncbi:MAG: lysophospholipid acyltransferase family protein [Methylophilaceae bacterium]